MNKHLKNFNLHPTTNWALLGENMFTINELEAIHEASLDILESVGIYYEEQEARDYYKQAGANVDPETHIVKIPKWMVNEAIQSAPESWTYCGRTPDYDFPLEYGRVGFTPVGVCPSIRDLETGKVRPTVLKDLEDYARLVDQLDNMPVCWHGIEASDVPSETASLYAVKAYLTNSQKPTLNATFDHVTSKATIALAAAAVGGMKNLIERPIIIAGSCPKSPLNASESVTASVIEFAKAGLPVKGMPMVLAGITGPVTLAGTLVQHNCEALGNLILSQIIRKGTPFIYGSCTSAVDLRKGQCTTGSAEHSMFAAAAARMAHFYKLPSVVPGTWTDSKCQDLQAGMEKAFSALTPAVAGANLIFGAGGLAGGLVMDFSNLVIEDDLFQAVQFMLKGFKIDDITLAKDIIKEVGPKGEYIAEEHTFDNMREHQNYPKLFNREGQEAWAATGSKPIEEEAIERAKSLIANPNHAPLSDSVIKEMDYIIRHAEEELGIKNKA